MLPRALGLVWAIGLGLPLLTVPAGADCLACFELRGAELETTRGEIISGYLLWFRHALRRPDAAFPEALLDEDAWVARPRSLRIYQRVDALERPLPILVASRSDVRQIDLDGVRALRAKPGRHDGWEGAGGLIELPAHGIELLQGREPVATLSFEGEILSWYLVSFNPQIGKQELEARRQELARGFGPQLQARWEAEQVLVLPVAHD